MNLTLSTNESGNAWAPREMTSLYHTTMYNVATGAKSVYSRPYAYGAPNSYMVLFDTQQWGVFRMLDADSRSMGRFLVVLRYE